MTGASLAHARLGARRIAALANRLRPPCKVFTNELKVLTPGGRVRYPDATVACGDTDEGSDILAPVVVFEITSPSSMLTDRRVKAIEDATTPSNLAYVMLDQERPEVRVLRCAEDWPERVPDSTDAVIALPEIGVEIPLAALYAPPQGA
jgi:Uma2 family endonuclease